MHQTILQEYVQGTTLPTTVDVLQPHIREEQKSWHQNIVTDFEMIMQPVFWAYVGCSGSSWNLVIKYLYIYIILSFF